MTELVLDIETYPQSNDYIPNQGCRSYTKYFFQIDVNGNVNISEKTSCKNDGSGEKKNILSVNDNIPVPNYFINIIKALILQVTFQQIDIIDRHKNMPEFYGSVEHNIINQSAVKSDRGIYDQVYKKYWEMVIDTIKRIKQEVKKNVENPQDNLDIKTQLDTYITKTKQQQENIVDLEKKIENIQTAYFDTLNDNKKLKELIKTKNNKQTELEIENNRLLQELNNIKLDEHNKIKEQQRLEELEKERLWIEYKIEKQNYNPLSR